jgi:hypothetical protein
MTQLSWLDLPQSSWPGLTRPSITHDILCLVAADDRNVGDDRVEVLR